MIVEKLIKIYDLDACKVIRYLSFSGLSKSVIAKLQFGVTGEYAAEGTYNIQFANGKRTIDGGTRNTRKYDPSKFWNKCTEYQKQRIIEMIEYGRSLMIDSPDIYNPPKKKGCKFGNP